MRAFKMPALGADMEAGMLAEWLVKPGDRVKSGDIVCVVETQKGAIEVEIFEDGTITEMVVQPGEEVPVGTTLAWLDGKPAAAAEAEAAPPPSRPTPAPSAVPVRTPAPAATARPMAPAAARTPVSPAARRRAGELAIDPERLAGTGIDGSVTLADVEAAAMAPRAEPAPAAPPATLARKGFDPAEMRQAIAAAMQRSKREIPHYYLGLAVDMGKALDWLKASNQERPPAERLIPAVLLLKATALALKEVPQLNGFYADGTFRPGDGIHVGWAISLRGGGLVAPAIRDADRLDLRDLMAALRDLVQRARSGGLRASELGSATITVTSLGERGADSVIGVIYPPQVVLVGFGRIAERPWIVAGSVTARPLVEVTLAADHRVCDGHLGGQLLAAIEKKLQTPETL